jgi:hypothetical protein
MKYNKIIILLLFAILFAYGCEELPIGENFLTKAPGVDVTVDTVFNKMEYAERYLAGAYDYLRYGLQLSANANSTVPATNPKPWTALMGRDLMATITDEIQSYLMDGGAWKLWYTGLYDANTESMGQQNSNYPPGASSRYNYIQEGSWVAIRICYNFIKNVDRVPDGDAAYKKKLKAEAYGIIACMYTDMFRNFGGLPWINHAYTITDSIGQMPRLTAQAMCDSIVMLCDKATADLPFSYRGIDLVNYDGHLTGGGMMGLKARALLFNASPLFNASAPYLDGNGAQLKLAWHGGYDAGRWKKAMDAAHDLIVKGESTGDYGIYRKAGNSFRKDFQDAYYLRGNGEQLITTRKLFKSPTSATPADYIFYREGNSGTNGQITLDHVDAYPMLNGKPISDPTSGYNPNDPFLNRDWRLKETVAVNGDTWQGRTVELWIGGRERLLESTNKSKTGFFLRKFLLEANTATALGSIICWPYLRMAEIYLSYAEASNEYKGAPDAEAYRCVNIVRNRVGLPDLAAGMTKEQFREAVITERQCELAIEEVRWYDLARWKREADFKKQLRGLNIYRSTTTPYTYTYTQFNLPTRYWQVNWSPKWYLLAFPNDEIMKGYGLIQNPGWE